MNYKMLEYLKPNMSGWDFELQGFREPVNDGYRIIGLENGQVVNHGDASRAGGNGDSQNKYNFNSVLWNKNRKYEKDILDKSIINDMNLKGII